MYIFDSVFANGASYIDINNIKPEENQNANTYIYTEEQQWYLTT